MGKFKNPDGLRKPMDKTSIVIKRKIKNWRQTPLKKRTKKSGDLRKTK